MNVRLTAIIGDSRFNNSQLPHDNWHQMPSSLAKKMLLSLP